MARPDGGDHGRPRARGPGGTLARAVALVDRYGDEIEADLHETFGLDLLDWLRGRHPWGKLLRLLEQLPAHSRYRAAVADDDDHAELLLQLYGDDEPPRRDLTLEGWTAERDLLTSLTESVREMHATLIAAHTKDGQRKEPPPLPRPRTGLQRRRRVHNISAAQAVTAAFNPTT